MPARSSKEPACTKILCVKQEQSNVGLEARCNGADETFDGEVVQITTSGDADPTASQGEIKAALAADPDIDAVFATGPDRRVTSPCSLPKSSAAT